MSTRIMMVVSLICAAVLGFTGTAIGATNASLFVYNPSEVQVGEEFDVTVELNGDPGADLSFIRACIDAGAGNGAQCSEALNHGTVPVFKVTYQSAGTYGLSVWLDAYSDGEWRFYGDVTKIEKSINVTESGNPQPGTDAKLEIYSPESIESGVTFNIAVRLTGNLPQSLNLYRICIDSGKGDGAQCSETLNHSTWPNFMVMYQGATTYGISAWVDVFFEDGWRFYGEVSKVEQSIAVTESSNPPSNQFLELVVPDAALTGQSTSLQVYLKGYLSEPAKFRLCIDSGTGAGAQCSPPLDNGTVFSVPVVYTVAVPHTVSAWVDANVDGEWHFYPEVPKIQKTIQVSNTQMEVGSNQLYLPTVRNK